MSTYSFLDITGAMTGPGGSVNLGVGAAVAEEGVTIAMANDKNVMTIGADGAGMNSLVADQSGQVTVRLLKTSPVNAQLATMYNYQTSSSAFHGQNKMMFRDPVRGDVITVSGAAFKKFPDISFAKEGGINEWVFDATSITHILGVGTPEI